VSKTSVIPAGITVVGDIEGRGDLIVAGVVEGPIELEGELSIEEGGVVRGKVSAVSILVRGVLEGNATAKEHIRIAATAHVVGDTRALRVHIVEGARVRGRVQMTGQLPVPNTARRRRLRRDDEQPAGEAPRVEPKREEPKREEPKREATRPVEPRREEPRRVEPRREEVRPVEARRDVRVEPKREEPRPVEPRRVEPRREEPRREEARPVEARREEPRRVEPRREEPRPVEARVRRAETSSVAPAPPLPRNVGGGRGEGDPGREPRREEPRREEPRRVVEPKRQEPRPVEARRVAEPRREETRPVETRREEPRRVERREEARPVEARVRRAETSPVAPAAAPPLPRNVGGGRGEGDPGREPRREEPRREEPRTQALIEPRVDRAVERSADREGALIPDDRPRKTRRDRRPPPPNIPAVQRQKARRKDALPTGEPS
jgi:cytoskeletal protein CcmA (bactofilin family)